MGDIWIIQIHLYIYDYHSSLFVLFLWEALFFIHKNMCVYNIKQ